jgi:tetratricopeptide (TPR) repeat protein
VETAKLFFTLRSFAAQTSWQLVLHRGAASRRRQAGSLSYIAAQLRWESRSFAAQTSWQLVLHRRLFGDTRQIKLGDTISLAMVTRLSSQVLIASLVAGSLIAAPASFTRSSNAPQATRPALSREDAFRANNIGVALLEQFKYKDAAGQFRRALQLDPDLGIARINLAIALYNEPDLVASLQEARAASRLLPDAPQPYYVQGLIARAQNRANDAIEAFERVLKSDPRDVGTNVNLAQIYNQQGRFADAVKNATTAAEEEPYNMTAVYVLSNALRRSGKIAEAQQMQQRFLALRDGGYATALGTKYLEQGHYAEAIASTGAEPGLIDQAAPDVRFSDQSSTVLPPGPRAAASPASSPVFERQLAVESFNEEAKKDLAAAFGGGVTLFDFDGDGDLDLAEAFGSTQRLYRNDSGKLVEVTNQAGDLGTSGAGVATGLISGDFDNDEKPDLFLLRYGRSSLYRNEGAGRFADVTQASGIPAYPFLAISAAFVDVDHDGDLDIFIPGFVDLARLPASGGGNRQVTFPGDLPGAPNLLLRNNGNGLFTDITAAAKVTGSLARGVAVVATDYDNRRDIDLLVVNYNATPTLFRNIRDGSFSDVAAAAGLPSGPFTGVAAADTNKDGFVDFYFGAAGSGGVLATSDGRGRFDIKNLPAASGTGPAETGAALFLDYDNDGLADLATVSGGGSSGLRLLRNTGSWTEVAAGDAVKTMPRVLAAGEIDGDGDTDLVVRDAAGSLRFLRNDGGNRNNSLPIRLVGKVGNRSGVASKIDVRAGSLRQRIETYAASPNPGPSDVVAGLGRRTAVDAVRVLWPSGIVQAETEMPKPPQGRTFAVLTITELDRKPSSCPYLYTWNGERFEFITDFMGGGEMGYLHAPGVYNYPDPDEYVRIRGDQLSPENGHYEIRVTNELEETLYIDRIQLVAVDHSEDLEIFPNEGMTVPPRPFKLFAVRNALPPAAATDDHGHDVLDRVARLDRRYPDDFRLHRIRGYAEEHTLTLDLGKPRPGGTVLLLTGWTDYSFSSDNLAAHQAGLGAKPPELQIRNADGSWKTAISQIGIPVGRPQTIALDLTSVVPPSSREIRIVTNMRIYWDQVQVATAAPRALVRLTRLDPVQADLRWRGFSAETTPDGREPFGYDYSRVSASSPWKTMSGRFTREGNVRSLVTRTDDIFVVSPPGDELALSFDSARLPRLRRGWKRTFLLYADGFSKEMDINSASPDQVLPLPFHSMSRYPYSLPERYPMTRERKAYLERYNTRTVRSQARAELALTELQR